MALTEFRRPWEVVIGKREGVWHGQLIVEVGVEKDGVVIQRSEEPATELDLSEFAGSELFDEIVLQIMATGQDAEGAVTNLRLECDELNGTIRDLNQQVEQLQNQVQELTSRNDSLAVQLGKEKDLKNQIAALATTTVSKDAAA